MTEMTISERNGLQFLGTNNRSKSEQCEIENDKRFDTDRLFYKFKEAMVISPLFRIYVLSECHLLVQVYHFGSSAWSPELREASML